MVTMAKRHPNAAAALTGGAGLGAVVTYVLGLAGVHVPQEVAAAIAGGAATLVLLIGREGLRGLLRAVWYGKDSAK